LAELVKYFENDFEWAFRISLAVPQSEEDGVVAHALFDFGALSSFFSIFVPGTDRTVDYIKAVLDNFEGLELKFDGRVFLPASKHCPAKVSFERENFDIGVTYFGESRPVHMDQILCAKRIFLYCETEFDDGSLEEIHNFGLSMRIPRIVDVRGPEHAKIRSLDEHPLAFICHDSRDKNDVVRPLVYGLRKSMCPVWYDEDSMSVGDSLHDGIMDGIKHAPTCVLILSKNFFSNKGWSKAEFDSIYTKEIIEQKRVILPVWFNVTKNEVYDYSPRLADIIGVNWQQDGEKEVCRKLAAKILNLSGR